MKKELLILQEESLWDVLFNKLNKYTKAWYYCELESIQDFEKNKEELKSIYGGVWGDNYSCDNYLADVIVSGIKKISDVEKKLEVFDFSGELSLNVPIIKNTLFSLQLSELGKEINKVKTLNNVEIIFTYEFQNKSKCYIPILQFINKNDDNEEKKSQSIIKPVYDLVLN